MKKILILVLGLVLGVQAFGQTTRVSAVASQQKAYCFFEGGYLNPVFDVTEGSTRAKFAGNGAYAGIGVEYKGITNRNMTFSLALDFYGANYRVDAVKLVEYGLTVPVRFNYTTTIGNDIDLMLLTGPSVMWGFDYRLKFDAYEEKFDETFFDIMYGFGAGVVLSDTVKLVCGYDFGLLKIEDGVRRDVFHIGVGYNF